MKIKNVYKTNVVFACIYFTVVSLSTVGAALTGNINSNNLEIRTIFCFIFSAIMLFISLENYKNQRNILNESINSILLKIAIILFYIYILFSCAFYIYETISTTMDVGARHMAFGALIMLHAVNSTIKKNN
ncbi:hypothetical protein ABGF49_06185 [Helcococcus ovis]|uniref:Uncharacterized protein n=2 Tax=Helcococcus ovis TaxID=72026 RepID=A0A4R9BZS7_9FIRM|nr:hypothetical protein [Helcococcus ovis]TFF63972.1 hypothetical protein EQF92_07705 [Helcococcus ovis]TFF64548.1 hypothetical protein EQF91_07575 [Helcococcus ovis]